MDTKTLLRAALGAAAALTLCAGLAPLAHAQAACRFQLGFADLARSLGPERVGACVEDQRLTGVGNAEQLTSRGLLVWRKLDNWTAFTDGNRTWISGPNGVEERGNSERFAWEPDAGWPGTTSVGVPPPAAPAPVATVGDLGVPAASVALQLTVLSVERVESRAAPAGKNLLRVRVNVAPGTRGVGAYDYLDFRVRSREGYEYRVWAGTPSLPHGLTNGTLRRGEAVEGELEFEVAKDASGFTLLHDYQSRGDPRGVITRRLDALA